jgi:hypothetical protein
VNERDEVGGIESFGDMRKPLNLDTFSALVVSLVAR